MSGVVNLTPIVRGDPRTITVTVVDGDGLPVDLSESEWSSTVRPFATSSTGIDLEVDESASALGVLLLKLTGDKSRLLDNRMVGDLEGSTFGTIMSFTAAVEPDVTRKLAEPFGGIVDNIVLTWSPQGLTLSSVVQAILLGGSASVSLEQVMDNLGMAAIVAGTSLTKVYDDAAGTITLSVDAADFDPAGSAAAVAAASQPRRQVLTDTTAAYTVADAAKVSTALQPSVVGTSVASLVGGVVPDGQLPAGLTRDTELVAAINDALNALIDGAPEALNTLNELAAAVNDNASFAATITTLLADKQPLNLNLTNISALTTTTFGRSLLELASAAAGRTALGLGTASTSDATAFDPAGSAAAAQAASQPLDADLTAIAALTTTPYGRALLLTPDQATLRTTLGLGTAAYQPTTAFATAAQGSLAATAVQPGALGSLAFKNAVLIGDISATGVPSATTYLRGDGTWGTPAGGGGGGGDLLAANNLSELTNFATARTNLGLGSAALSAATAFQPASTSLTTIAGLPLTNNNMLVVVSGAWASRTPSQVKATLSLDNVTNTSDANKPVSTAQASALALKANLASPTFTGTVSGITKSMVGLGNVDNTSDANKPVSTAQQAALDAQTHDSADITDLTEAVQDIVGSLIVAGSNVTVSYDDVANTFTINSTAGGGGGTDAEVVRDTIAAALVASNGIQITVDDVNDTITIASTAVLPTRSVAAGTGLTGGGDLSVDRTIALSAASQTSLAKADTAVQPDSPTFTGTVSGITKGMVGLGNVDNTSDADKPVSTAQASALAAKAPLASPTFTGTVSGISKGMVGLGNVDNTSDADKPVSTAQAAALANKVTAAQPSKTLWVGTESAYAAIGTKDANTVYLQTAG